MTDLMQLTLTREEWDAAHDCVESYAQALAQAAYQAHHPEMAKDALILARLHVTLCEGMVRNHVEKTIDEKKRALRTREMIEEVLEAIIVGKTREDIKVIVELQNAERKDWPKDEDD